MYCKFTENSDGMKVSKAKFFEAKFDASWGWGAQPKKPSIGEVQHYEYFVEGYIPNYIDINVVVQNK